MTVQVQHQALHMIVTAKRYYRCDCSGQYHHYAADHIGNNENNKKILMITPVTIKMLLTDRRPDRDSDRAWS